LGLDPRRKYPNMPILKSSLRSVARQLGIRCHKTLKYWIIHGLPYTKDKTQERGRGRKSKLTDQQQQLVHGYILFLQNQYLPITRDKIYFFIKTQINPLVSKMLVSRFLKKIRWTRRKALQRQQHQLSDTYLNDCLDFISEIRSLNLTPEKIFVMDETGIWTNRGSNTTYAPRGR
jgi:hypothetical protein